MAEIVISVAAKVAEYLVAPIARRIGYVWYYKSSFHNLETEVRKLEGRNETVQQSVVEARRQGLETFDHVQDWMARVQNMVDEASEVVQEKDQSTMKCFKGLCPNPKKRYQHGRKAAKKAKDVAELCAEGNFTTVSYRAIPKEIWIPSHKGYEAFESRTSTLKDILNDLINPDVNVIGVYGTGGIGKTMLAREVAAHAEDKKLFDVVAFAEVNVKPDIKEIQQEIADKLGLTFHEESVSGRARSLQQRLKQEKKVLLVLDNIWERFDLEKVGIPFDNDVKGCKLLLTARSLDVLSKMDCQSNFQIGILDKEEAWSLFKKKAGSCIGSNDHLQALAKKVTEACGGLPIAVNSVAVALKGKGESVWKNALHELTTPSPRNFEGVAAETYSSIEISFNQLKGEELKSTFLLCSIMGNTLIENLLAYGMGLGMFKSIQTIEQARNRVIALIQQLEDSSLLLDVDNEKFSLHDVVCDVARSIASRDRHMFTVTSDVIPRELVDKDVLKNCIKISLHKIDELPSELECPRLKFLYMRTTRKLLKVPYNFFSRMLELKVLHLVRLELNSVSNSLGCLEKLQTLYLDSCFLHYFYFISGMKQLEILRISGRYFRELPMEMRNLTGLRLLNLNDCYNLKNIPPNVLSALTQLEELYLCPRTSNIKWDQSEELSLWPWTSNIKWEVEGIKILDELKHLSLLTTMEISIPNADVLPQGCFLSKKLERYKILIGNHFSNPLESLKTLRGALRGTSRMMMLDLVASSCCNDVLHTTSSVEKFLSILDGKGFPDLEFLNVKNSLCFRTVVGHLKLESSDPFPWLNSLDVARLFNLENIYNRQLRAESFHQLRTIKVRLCDKLKNIFSFSANSALPLLQEVRVSFCNNMEEIFAIGTEEDINNNELTDHIEFKQLRSLWLSTLPKLTSFCTINNHEVSTLNPLFNEKVVFSNLEALELRSINLEKIWHNELSADSSCFQCLRQLKIERCSNVKVLFSSSTVAFPSLENVQLLNMDNLKMIWSNQLCKDSFGSLKSMKVKRCRKLSTIFQSNILEGITRLESLTVKHCDWVENIYDIPGIDLEASHPRIDNRLRNLDIYHLPKLKHIWSKDPQKMFSFPKLKNVKVRDCWSLKYFFPISIAKNLLELEQLDVSYCGVEKIVVDEREANEAATFVFPQITSLMLYNLPELKTFYHGVHISHWPNLKTLELDRCDQVELLASELFDFQENKEGQHDLSIQPLFMVDKDSFANLEKLIVHGDLKLLLQGHFSEQLFCNLKFLEVWSDKSLVYPLYMLQKFRYIQQLYLNSCIYKEIFSYEETETHVGSLYPSGWKYDSKLDMILHTIESLKLNRCNNLIKLVPSSLSFQNLTYLTVQNCDSLKNLVTSSTAKSLVQLKEMTIEDCKSMTEVVVMDKDVKEKNIIFSRLRTLKLVGLSSLVCFCSENYIFELPSLEELIVDECPKMKYFSSGVVTTLILQKVRRDWRDCKLEGDLNTTIQQT